MVVDAVVKGCLVLEDGRAFGGQRFGAESAAALGEVVFNTSMMGYPEIITDPSYAGEIVVMTYPMIGNYGVTSADFESRQPFLSALVVKEISRIASNWRHEQSLPAYLKENGIVGLSGVDTRALVRHLRSHGAMRGIIADLPAGLSMADSNAEFFADQRALACGFPTMSGKDLASQVTEGRTYVWEESSAVRPPGKSGSPLRVVAFDFGIKRNILRRLVDVGCRVQVVGARTTAAEVLALKPDGVFLSNGPGDPDPIDYAVESIQGLLGRVPIFGICLGHQLLARAVGGKTYKLKFGHRGGNHPVKDLNSGAVMITAHNHGFSVAAESLPERAVVTHMNLNDNTVEGIRIIDAPAFSVQFHPEAAPGPHDAAPFFNQFVDLMRQHKDGDQ